MTIYEITEEMSAKLEAYYLAETEEEADAAFEALGVLSGELDEKAEVYAKVIRNIDGEVKALKDEEKRLESLRKRRENVVKRMKGAIETAMIVSGAKAITTSIGKWRLQKNPYSCRVIDRDKVPERFRVLPDPEAWTVDAKAMIAEFKQTGEEFDGVVIEQKEGVRFG